MNHKAASCPCQRWMQLFVILFSFMLSSCLGKPIQLDRAMIQNDSSQVIRDVKIVHEPTNTIGEVNMVLPHSAFELGYLDSEIKANRAEVSWRDAQGRARQTAVSIPTKRRGNEKMVLIYRFLPGSSVLISLEPVAE